ncbi:MAG: 16S rRNA (cytosine(967)-C(5))-methyltransferase RsmB [Alkaliphilus sp.]
MNGREGALRVLFEIEANRAYSNIALKKELKHNKFSQLDRAFMSELVFGVLENKMYLDYIIDQFSSIKTRRMNTHTLNLLRLGTYQIFLLDKIPESAAVNESVNLSKEYCKKSSGFINAVLRNIIRKKDSITMPDIKTDIVRYLAVTYSHPEWMVKLFLKSYSESFTEDLLKANNSTPSLYMRVNTLKINVEECIKFLTVAGYTVKRSDFAEEGLKLEGATNLDDIDLLDKGYLYIQDIGSMLVSILTEPKENEIIIDLCSAPGGKATHLAQIMNNKGRIIARDIYDHKLDLISRNAKRLGVNIIKAEKSDGLKLDTDMIEKADKVLVDAPCSGLGIIKRKPDIKYNISKNSIEEIIKTQEKILSNAAKYVKRGGYLIYSTCTVNPKENELMIKQFLKLNTNYELVDLTEKYKKILFDASKKTIQLYPNIQDSDGFFIAKMRKMNE